MSETATHTENKDAVIELTSSDSQRLEKLTATLINREMISSMREHLREMDARGWIGGKSAAEIRESEERAVSSVFEDLADLKEFDGLLPDPDTPEPEYDKAVVPLFAVAESLMYKTDEEVEEFFKSIEEDTEDTELPEITEDPEVSEDDQEKKDKRIQQVVNDLFMTMNEAALAGTEDRTDDYIAKMTEVAKLVEEFGDLYDFTDEERERLLEEKTREVADLIDSLKDKDDGKEARKIEIIDEMPKVIKEAAAAKAASDKAVFDAVEDKLKKLVDEYAELTGMDKDEKKHLMDQVIAQVEEKAAKILEGAAEGTTPEATKTLEELKSPELLQLEAELRQARNTLAALNVRAAGKIVTGLKFRRELEEANSEWRRLQTQVGLKAIEFARELGMDLSDAQKLTEFAASGAIAEAKELAELEAELAENGQGGNILKRAYRGYARRYNDAGRIKKALYLAPIGLVAGIAAGTIVGAVGGGIFAGIVAKGAVKGAVVGKLRGNLAPGRYQTDEESLRREVSLNPESIATTLEEAAAMRAAFINMSSSRERIDRNIKTNRKRMAGAVAVGAVIGGVAGAVTNHFIAHQDPIRGGGMSKHNAFGGQRPSTGAAVDHQTGGGGGAAVGGEISPKLDPIQYAGSRGIDLGAKDAWPFKVAGQLGLSEQDSINLARENGFTFRDGMYWINGRIMNPEEMKWHNLGLAEIAANRFQG